MRYEIAFNKELYKLLDDISYAVWRIKNRATTAAYDWQQFSFGFKERYGDFPKPKDVLESTVATNVYAFLKEIGDFVGSTIIDCSIQEAIKKFEKDKSEILRGSKSISQYRKDGSFPLRAQAIKNIDKINAKKYTANFSLLSKEGAKERNCKTQVPITLKTGYGANAILDRIIDGEYKLCDSRIARKGTKYYLMVAYQFMSEKAQVDDRNVLGVDLGIVNAAYMATNFSRDRAVIEGNEIITFRQRIEARRNSLLRQGKYAGEGRRGHGRTTALKPIEKLRGKVENFRQTTNHKYAKYIVYTAVKYGCGTIQMEDISGIEKRDVFLRNWPYYNLQQYIEYKAKERGIVVKYINPQYTSQRCSCCGYIAKGNRKEQSKFECVQCGYKANADYNAAKNIADPDIESKIKSELKRQRSVMQLALAE